MCPESDDDLVLNMEGITKRFGEVVALNEVDFSVGQSEIMGLAGDNGAGKSTLIKCLAGVHKPNAGRIFFEGQPVTIGDPREAQRLGIETTYQELALAPNLTVAENIFLGRELTRTFGGVLTIRHKSRMVEMTDELLDQLDLDISPTSTVDNLSGGERQLVAIARTMLTDPTLVIMDEPTSALSVEAAEKILDLIERMRREGASVVVISHNFDHLRTVCDTISVLHAGENAGTLDAEEATRERIVQLMIAGRPDADAMPSAA